MKIATWNVNSLNVRLPHLLEWLAEATPDIVCLQELKQEDHKFPLAELQAAGYHCAAFGQKTYNGVAILSRTPLADIQRGNPLFPDEQSRLITATIDGIRVVCAYMPNGQEVGCDKYQYKLAWLQALQNWLAEERQRHSDLVLCGDFNIAPDDRDVHDPQYWTGRILCSDAERQAFQALLSLGFCDSFRLFDQPEKTFSWWDYRMLGFQKNLGLRIDHLLLSAPLAARCTASWIDRAPRKRERPSDHAPALVEIQ